jgi:tetratricopeptide (TPR) repeat protein
MARIDRSGVQQLTDPHGMPTERLLAELAEARAVLEAEGNDEALAIMWLDFARAEWNPCRFDAAGEAAAHAVEHARRAGARAQLVDSMTILMASGHLGSSTPGQGRPVVQAAVDALGREGQVGQVAQVIEAYYDALSGDFDGARAGFRRAEDQAERYGAEVWKAACWEFVGEVELMAGDPEGAERAWRKEHELHLRIGDEGHASTSAGYLALALCRLGRFEEADDLATNARRLGAEDDLATQGTALAVQALVRSARGEHDEALRLARDAVDQWKDAQSPKFQGDTWTILAEVARAADLPDEAAEAARTALALYERKGNQPSAASARAFLDELAR